MEWTVHTLAEHAGISGPHSASLSPHRVARHEALPISQVLPSVACSVLASVHRHQPRPVALRCRHCE